MYVTMYLPNLFNIQFIIIIIDLILILLSCNDLKSRLEPFSLYSF
jgi:hypothetical protein